MIRFSFFKTKKTKDYSRVPNVMKTASGAFIRCLNHTEIDPSDNTTMN